MNKEWDNITHLEDSVAVKQAYPSNQDRCNPLKSVMIETIMDIKDLLRAAESAGFRLNYTERIEEVVPDTRKKYSPAKKRIRLSEKRRTRL